jgi:hypothetical protein
VSTFGDTAADRLRTLDRNAASYLAAELRNLATVWHCHLTCPDSDLAGEAADALQALLVLADRLDHHATVDEDVAHARRDSAGVLTAMSKRGVW